MEEEIESIEFDLSGIDFDRLRKLPVDIREKIEESIILEEIETHEKQ